MKDNNFENPSRQSAKGIIVIFGVSTFKLIKGLFILIVALLLKYLQSDKAPDLTSPKVLLSIVGIIIVFLTIAVLRYLNFKFYLKNDYFFLQQGILNKEEISVSLTKIQNVYIKQNLLQQIINVVSLSIETAGDDKTEIEISALSKPKANALKEKLLSAKETRIVFEDSDSERLYYKASIIKLLLEGISENHFKSFVLILAFIISIYNDIKDFVFNFEATARFREWFQLDNQSFMALLLFNASVIVVLLVLSFLISLIRMLIQNFDLTVIRKPDGLEISKGLFNTINLGLSSSRIQTITVSTNRVKKFLGLYKLAFTQAMANKKQQLNFNIVGLNILQIDELVQQFYPDVNDKVIKKKPHNYFIYRTLWLSFFVLLLINLGFSLLPVSFLLLNIPLLIYVGLHTYFSYKKKYYHVDENYIIIGGGGFIETNTNYLETHKIQSILLKQTVFQKRRGLASLIIFSASKSLTIPHIKKADALQIENYLLFLVEYKNKDWM